MPTAWNFDQVAFQRTAAIGHEQIQTPSVDFNWKSTRKQEIRFWVYSHLPQTQRLFHCQSCTGLKNRQNPVDVSATRELLSLISRNAKADV